MPVFSRAILLGLMLLGAWGFGNAQAGSYNANAPYFSVSSEHFEVVYQEGLDSVSQSVLGYLEWAYAGNTSSLNIRPGHDKVKVVLETRNQMANGYVTPMPFHSSWFNGQVGMSGMPWFQTLAVHEGRHVIQEEQMRSWGAKRVLHFLFGDSYTTIVMSLFVPAWWSEGDAVLMETVLTKGGRGRRPAFTMQLRALDLEGKRMGYYQNYLGRGDDERLYANHYEMGYLLTTDARRRFGSQVWNSTLKGTSKWGVFPTFDYSLWRATGDTMDMTDLYSHAFDELHKIWQAQVDSLVLTPTVKAVTSPKSMWSARWIPEIYRGQVYFVDVDKRKGVHFATEKNGQIEFLHEVSFGVASIMSFAERHVSFHEGKWAWTQNVPDIRRSSINTSDIYVYDQHSDQERRLTFGAGYQTVGFASDGRTLIAHELDTLHKARLVLLDAESGRVLKSVENPAYFHDFQATAAGNFLASRIDHNGFSLVEISGLDLSVQTLIGPTHDEDLRSPVEWGDFVVYQSDFSGIDQVWALNRKSGERFQIATTKYGAWYPRVAGDTLYFSDYTTLGAEIVKAKLDTMTFTPMQSVRVLREEFFAPVQAQEKLAVKVDSALRVSAPVPTTAPKPYSPLGNSVNIHSHLLLVSTENVRLSLSQNDVLGILDGSVAVGYDRQRRAAMFAGALTYSQLFPLITAFGDYDYSDFQDSILDTAVTSRRYDAGLRLVLPFNFSRGMWSRGFDLGIQGAISDVHNDQLILDPDGPMAGRFYPISYMASAMALKEKPRLAVGTRLGLVVNGGFDHTVGDSRIRSQMVWGQALAFLPGLWWTHNIALVGSMEKQLKEDGYTFSHGSPRAQRSDVGYYRDYYFGRAQYKLPLAWTSMHWWKLFYWRGVDLSLYGEYGLGHQLLGTDERTNAGVGLHLPCNLFSNEYFILEPVFYNNYDFQEKEYFFSFAVTAPF